MIDIQYIYKKHKDRLTNIPQHSLINKHKNA